jgi:hypothetical protein
MTEYTQEERIALAAARGILVDPQDRWLLEEYTWHVDGGYVATNVPVPPYQMRARLHHCIMGQPIWEGDEIDHKNRNTLDNRRSNLRYATVSENRVNTSREVGKSTARNVYLRPDGKFRVQISRNGIRYCLGDFGTLDEAVAERDEWLYQHKEYVS